MFVTRRFSRRFFWLALFPAVFVTAWPCLILFLFLTLPLDADFPLLPSSSLNFKRPASLGYNPLQHIPTSTVGAWRARDFIVVFGIPSEDIEARRRRRDLQRTTCWQYDGVATRSNAYNGSMLVMYVLGRSPLNRYLYSAEMLREARQWHDIVALDTNEGVKTTNKEIGKGKDDWGFEAMVGNSQKVFMWFDLALRTFPRARYVGKGDDDMFLRVPQYLADFRLLPPRGVYWGRMIYFRRLINNSRIIYVTGSCVTLERSVVESFVSFTPVRNAALVPYSLSLVSTYIEHVFTAEDVMIGLALKRSGYSDLTLVDETCRFHDIHSGAYLSKTTSESLMIHHVNEEDYEQLMKQFASVPVLSPKLLHKHKNIYHFTCENK